MAVWSEVELNRIVQFQRFDGDFYTPENENLINTLFKAGNCSPFSNYIAELTDGKHGGVTYTDEGVVFLRNQNIKNGKIDFDDIRYISEKESNESYRAELKPLDIVITTIGTLGQIAIFPEKFRRTTINQNLVRISTQNINTYFLAVFFMTKYGNRQITRLASGNVQPIIVYPNLKKIFIYAPSPVIQEEIGILFQQSITKHTLSQSLYTEAQNLLEQELGLDKLTFEKSMGYEARFREVVLSHRLDAQHFREKYNVLFQQIKKNDWQKIQNIRSYNRRGVQPVYIENGSHSIVNSKHISKQHLDYDNFEKTSALNFKSSPEAHINENDLLIYTTGAYIGSTNVYLSDTPALASNHVNILRVQSAIDATYLAIVFQSVIGQLQTEKYLRGSAQAELYPSDIDKFIVPILNQNIQKEIGNLARKSLSAKQESQQLLEQAKTRVETLIEEAAEKNGE